MNKLRFISASSRPSDVGGWAVSNERWRWQAINVIDVINTLDNALTQGVDYVVEYHGNGEHFFKRIVFKTDEAFIMGKMIL